MLAFLDDILVLGRDFGDHLASLRVVFERFRTYGLKLKPRKCDLFRKKVEFLGRVVGPEGMEIGPGYVKDVKNWPKPRNSKEVERFLGFANYHRAFIKDYTNIALPLQALTGKRPYFWGNEQQQSFDRLREAMVSAPVLSLPNATDPFILDTDASDKAIGAELLQVQGGQERATSYASFTLTPEQQKYCTTRKELLAIVRSFNSEQKEALRSVPPYRILLESDAPYFPPPNARHGHPHYLYEVAKVVGTVRANSPREIVRVAHLNGSRLYGVNP